jgi:hypothetical protein
MAPALRDPRMTSVKPHIRYNTIGGVNGPLVILDNVLVAYVFPFWGGNRTTADILVSPLPGQIPKV